MVEIYPYETCRYGDGMTKPMRGNENQTLMDVSQYFVRNRQTE